MKYYRESAEAALQALESGPGGLTAAAAARRRAQYGPNRLAEGKKATLAQRFLAQLKDPMIIILLAGAFISAFLRELVDAGIIVSVIALNALIGVMQQYRSEKALEALKDMSSPRTKVLRDATFQQIDSWAILSFWSPETSFPLTCVCLRPYPSNARRAR